VPVPDKLDVYPEELDADFKSLSGKVVNPAFRKLLVSLAKEGVEVVDLLPALLQAKAASGAGASSFCFNTRTRIGPIAASGSRRICSASA